MSEFEKMAIERLEAGGFDKTIGVLDYDNIVKAYDDMANTSKMGLLFIGGSGSGKTLAMKALAPRATFYALTDSSTHETLEPYERFFEGVGVKRWWAIEDCKSVILDDVGNEPIKNDYGTKIQTVANFILHWYAESFKRAYRKGRINLTSNLSMEQLVELYGARVTDRLFEMVNTVQFKGKSHRTPGRIYG